LARQKVFLYAYGADLKAYSADLNAYGADLNAYNFFGRR